MKAARKLGANVAYLMSEKGITISAISNVLQLKENQFYAFLKGLRLSSYDIISKIAHILDVSVEELLERNYGNYSEDTSEEMLLDIIEHYVDIINATAKKD